MGRRADPAADVVREVRDTLRSLRGVWDEDAVDELDHALQSAWCAAHSPAGARGDLEFVVAALLHDVAHSPLVAGGGHGHEQVAQKWLAVRFGARAGWLAGAHVVAKRHLAATEPEYRAALSPTSVRSLAAQGGSGEVGPEWTGHPWWPDALRLRRCDDAAKVPGAFTGGLDWALEQVRLLAERQR